LTASNRSPDPQGSERFCATCGEPIGPDDEAAEVYRPADNEVTSRVIHAVCMTDEEEIA
jgi:hypothetical protein